MRMTITLSNEAKENLTKTQKLISEELGAGKITQGFAIGYVLKQYVDQIEKKKVEDK